MALDDVGDGVDVAYANTGLRVEERLDSALETIKGLESRIHRLHDALTRIDTADDDAFTTPESTVEYVVNLVHGLKQDEHTCNGLYDAVLAWRLRVSHSMRELDRPLVRAIDELHGAPKKKVTVSAVAPYDEGQVASVQPEASRPGDQPLPLAVDGPGMHDLVIADLRARAQTGLERYGQPLRKGNGRDALRDTYEEALDQIAYLRQLRESLDEIILLQRNLLLKHRDETGCMMCGVRGGQCQVSRVADRTLLLLGVRGTQHS